METRRNQLSGPAEQLRGLLRCQSRGLRLSQARWAGAGRVRWASVARWLIGGGKEAGNLKIQIEAERNPDHHPLGS